ncbi:MAG: hypothetical protein ACOH1X_07530 [Kaistella sp.]
MKKTILIVALLLFGAVTLFMSSSVLFDWFGIREKEGNFVPLIVWANWLCGILYLMAAFALWKNKLWAVKPLIISLIILILASVGLFVHINGGGLYETKTLGAMVFRLVITGIFTYLTSKIYKK